MSLRHLGLCTDCRRGCFADLVSSGGLTATGRQNKEGGENREERQRLGGSGHRAMVSVGVGGIPVRTEAFWAGAERTEPPVRIRHLPLLGDIAWLA